MAIIQTKSSSPLGTIGGLITLGGALIPGAGLLTPLGLGVQAAGGIADGNPQSYGTLGQILNGLISGQWQNPANESIGGVRGWRR